MLLHILVISLPIFIAIGNVSASASSLFECKETPAVDPDSGRTFACFGDNTYEIIYTGGNFFNWQGAIDLAASKTYKATQGHLVTIESNAETNFILNALDLNPSTAKNNNWLFIPASDRGTENVWSWRVQGGPSAGKTFYCGGRTRYGMYSNWSPSTEPTEGLGDHCVRVIRRTTSYAPVAGAWDANRCDLPTNYAVIEYEDTHRGDGTATAAESGGKSLFTCSEQPAYDPNTGRILACYKDNVYELAELCSAMNFYQADAFAAGRSVWGGRFGHVLSLETQDEAMFFERFWENCTENLGVDANSGTSTRLPLAGRDDRIEGQWYYTAGPLKDQTFYFRSGDRTIPGAFTNWYRDPRTFEPNNSPSGEHCVEVINNQKWNDYPCHSSRFSRYIIVEYEEAATTTTTTTTTSTTTTVSSKTHFVGSDTLGNLALDASAGNAVYVCSLPLLQVLGSLASTVLGIVDRLFPDPSVFEARLGSLCAQLESAAPEVEPGSTANFIGSSTTLKSGKQQQQLLLQPAVGKQLLVDGVDVAGGVAALKATLAAVAGAGGKKSSTSTAGIGSNDDHVASIVWPCCAGSPLNMLRALELANAVENGASRVQDLDHLLTMVNVTDLELLRSQCASLRANLSAATADNASAIAAATATATAADAASASAPSQSGTTGSASGDNVEHYIGRTSGNHLAILPAGPLHLVALRGQTPMRNYSDPTYVPSEHGTTPPSNGPAASVCNMAYEVEDMLEILSLLTEATKAAKS